MKIGVTGSGVVAIAGFVLVGGGALYLWLRYGDQVKKLATETLNPASSANIVNQGASAAVAAITGDKNQTVGGGLFDLFNPNAGLAPDEYLDHGVIRKRSSAPAAGLAPSAQAEFVLP